MGQQATVQTESPDPPSILIPFSMYKNSSLYKYRLHEVQPLERLHISEVAQAEDRNGGPRSNRYQGLMSPRVQGTPAASGVGPQDANRSFGPPLSRFPASPTSRPRLITTINPFQLTSGNHQGLSLYKPQPSTFCERAQSSEKSSITLAGDENDPRPKSPKVSFPNVHSSNTAASPNNPPYHQTHPGVVPRDAEVIDIDDNDDDQYVVIQDQVDDPEVVVISDRRFPDARPIRLRNGPATGRRKSSQAKDIELRNPSITHPFECRHVYAWSDRLLRPTMTVELRNGDFLKIQKIIYNTQTQEAKLRGHLLKRTVCFEGRLPEIDNELCFVYDVDLDDARSHEDQGAAEIFSSDILKVRRLRVTNDRFEAAKPVFGLLTARWKYTRTFADASDRIKGVEKEWTLERLQASDVPEKDSIPDDTRRAIWRGETVLGGAYRPSHESPSNSARKRKETRNDEGDGSATGRLKRPRVWIDLENDSRELTNFSPAARLTPSPRRTQSHLIDLIEDPRSVPRLAPTAQVADLRSTNLEKPSASKGTREGQVSNLSPSKIRRSARQTYTYGDMFCGAGGTTRGAAMAGLCIKYGVDIFNHACNTWHSNFPNADCYHMDVCGFCQDIAFFEEDAIVDILHLSPPCQYFSRAHTIAGKDDDMNTASLFAIEQALKVTRPRIATLEQTFSIIDGRFRFYFNALICQFTNQEYSIRWQIVQLAQLGLPQRRYRLIAIAACPGEILPRMPAATHGDPRFPLNGLKPYATVNRALASIPPDAEDHDIGSVIFAPDKRRVPYNGDGILPRAMTTSGGQNYHPGGQRDFTLREYAVLQGFPPAHLFRGKSIKKQIGNAVPPLIAKVLFECVKKQLEEADGVIDEGILLD